MRKRRLPFRVQVGLGSNDWAVKCNYLMKSDHRYLWVSGCLPGNELCMEYGGLYFAFGAVVQNYFKAVRVGQASSSEVSKSSALGTPYVHRFFLDVNWLHD